jgi:uncharacterized membrane protein YgcG
MLVRRHPDVPAFVRSLHLHYSIRLHAAILLVAAALAGLLLSLLLRWIGMSTPLLRFPIAVVAAYAFFLVLVDWWLHYLGLKRAAVDDVPDPGVYPSGSSPAHADGPAVAGVNGGGGEFDGGGASAGFDDGGSSQVVAAKAEVAARGKMAVAHAALETKAQAGMAAGEAAASSSVSAGDIASGAAGFGELALPVLVLVAVAGLFAAAGGWVIATTPAMLVETAVEVAIASGLIRSISRTRGSSWFASLFERSFGKALALAAMAFVLGLAVRWIDPSANTIGQAVARLFSH